MTPDQVAAVLSAVDTALAIKILVAATLLALTMGRFRNGTRAPQKVPYRKK